MSKSKDSAGARATDEAAGLRARAAGDDDTPGDGQSGAEAAVLDYLRRHPDLFVRHPQVLEDVTFPRPGGRVVSLVEYHVSVLRDQLHHLRRRLADLVANARRNEEVAERLHRITLSLISARSLEEGSRRLERALAEDFAADLVAIHVFEGSGPVGVPALARDAAADLFGLAGGRPLCGRLRQAQVQALFGDRHPEVASAALVPLAAGEPVGILAIGSRDPERYRPDMATDLLAKLGELAAHLLDELGHGRQPPARGKSR